jgi:imidazolonepropionase-like amidohydrolase
MPRFLKLLAMFLTSAACAAAAEPVRYSVLSASNPAGTQTTWSGPDGERRVEFEFNDRGRGPKLSLHVWLGPDGVPQRLEATGHDYFKNQVDEHFSIEAGHARWKNASENGEKDLAGKAFYLSLAGVPEEGALLAQALLASPGGSMPLLPEGEARIERVGELEVHAKGQSRKVVQYNVSGLGLSPTPVWLDQDQTFFAAASPWFAVLREGWESVNSDLVAAQDKAQEARFASLAKTLGRKPASAVVFRGATLFDSETAAAKPGMTVVVSGDKIAAVAPDAEVQAPAGAEVIDAKGKTLLPGLWDMHVHLGGPEDGLLHLAAGVTTVRDMANDMDMLLKLRQQFDAGAEAGPRILMAGFIDSHGPYQGPSKVLADTAEEARAAVDRYAELGYSQIKIYSSMKPELVPGIIERAHGHKLRVSGHIPAFMTAEQCVRLGFDEIQHINFLFLNFWADQVPDTRTPARFTEVAERAADLDLGSEKVRAFIALLKEHGTVVDPTVNVFEAMFTDRPGSVSRSFAPVASRLPPQLRRSLYSGGLPVPQGKDERYRASFQALLKMLRTLYEAGVPIEAGTDSFAGFGLHRELELYVEAGIPSTKVLQLATLGAARIMHRDAELGSVTPGKLADLVLVDGDPVWNMPDIRKVELVLRGGTVYRSADLDRALGILP